MTEEVKDIVRRRRIEFGLSQLKLGQLIGSHGQTINKIEKGEVKWSRYFERLERQLQLPPGTLTTKSPKNGSVPEPKILQIPHHYSSNPGPSMLPVAADLPVYRTIMENGDTFLSEQPDRFEYRPAELRNVRDSYAIIITDGAFVPFYERRSIIFVDAWMPVAPHRDCVLCEKEPHKGGRILIARLIDVADDVYIIWKSTFKKSETGIRVDLREVPVPRKDFPHCHAIVLHKQN